MAGLADLANFDAGRMIQFGQAGQKQRTLAELGQLASQGDYRGAQAAAFAGGETGIGLQLKQMNDADKAQLIDQAASWAYTANDPQKWEAGRQEWAAKGFDIGPFQSRDALISQALTVQDRMRQANADRAYALDQEKLAQAGTQGKFGLNPVLVQDANGNTVAYQTNSAGGAQPIQFPEGSRILNPADKAAMSAEGKAQGTNAVNLPSALAAGDRIIRGIDDALKDPALSSITGPIQGKIPRGLLMGEGARAQSLIDQIQGGTFLQAYNDLRGGGQITEAEGSKATAAYNRLARMDVNDADYVTALKSFRDEIVKLQGIARQRAGQATQVAPSGGGWSVQEVQ